MLILGDSLKSPKYGAVVELLDDRAQRKELVRAFRDLPGNDPSAWRKSRLLLVANQNSAVQYVDYSTPYYLNASRPVIGTSSVAAELSPEGTLAKGSAEVADNTVETLLGLLPIKEVLTNRLIPPDEAGFAAGEPRYRHTLTTEAVPVLHILSMIHAKESIPCGQRQELSPTDTSTQVSYTRTVPSVAASKPATPGNAINVSGQITMPEKKP